MHNNKTAVELIRKYQELFADLDHRQIAERLVTMLAERSGVHRAALVVAREGQLSVDALAHARAGRAPQASYLGTPLARCAQLPIEPVQRAFDGGEAVVVDSAELARLPVSGQCRGCYAYPVREHQKTLAVFYLETADTLPTLLQTVAELETFWVFSALLVRQLNERWHHEEQRERCQTAQQALWTSETYLNAILRHSPALISVKDLDGKVVLASDHYQHLARVDEAGFVGKNVFDVYPPEIAQTLWEIDRATGEGEAVCEKELDLEHKDGSLHTYLMVKFPLRNPGGEVFGVCTICTDISEHKMAQSALRDQQSRLNYMAFHDTLTELPNRSLFYDRVHHCLARSRRSQRKLALLLLDVDRFKVINDSLGHDSGDLLLQTIAERLGEGVRDVDTVARLGGDEFVVVLEGIHDMDDVIYTANKLLASLARPMEVAGHEISTTVSIGVSVFPEDGEDVDELLKNADIAMYKAKEAGKNNCQFYTRGMSATAVNYLLLENDLRRAIEQGQLCLYYQPQVDLASGELMSLEALVRWRHPERGLISPAHFIPLAEETGLIAPIGEWVLREACQQHQCWRERGLAVGRMAVNLSPRQFRQTDFPARVAQILRESGLPPECLELEITETSAMENAAQTISQLEELQRMNLSLAIDDFGTGYSSLAYLKRFPIHKLKIDGSFIKDIRDDANDEAIARSIIGLAHNMQLTVVAEGVEEDWQAQWLCERGCDQAQGYLFARPLSAVQMEAHFRGGRFYLDGNVVALGAAKA